MKKKSLFLSAMLTCVVSLFTSCVQGDMFDLYDEDGMEIMFPRKKGAKDNGSQLQGEVKDSPYYHRIVKALQTGCGPRALDSKFPGKWRDKVKEATEATRLEITDPEELAEFLADNYTDGQVDVNKVLGHGLDKGIMQNIIVKCGGNGPSAVGSICFISYYDHFVHIVSTGHGNEACHYLDMDGNVWAGEFLEKL